MIKINLLEVEKERKTKAAPAGAVPTGLLAIVIIGLGLLIFAFLYFQTSTKLKNLQKDVAQKREKKKELEPYIKKVEELEKRRNELALKNNAIETLRSQRTIPVHLMDEISRALPEYLWLSNLTLKGGVIAIGGETLQEQAIPTFMRNLDSSEFIGTPSLVETRVKSASGAQASATSFKLTAPVTNPFKPKEPVVTTTTTATPKKK